jgi:transposase-like protein
VVVEDIAMTESRSFLEILQWTPEQARDYLEEIRWPNGPACPSCGATEIYRIEAKTQRNGKPQPTRHLLKCKACKRQFTATVGTIFEDSHIPLNKWLAAIYLMCASKKGMSAHQLHRMLGVTYKTAWFMCHRVRLAMQDKTITPLSGVIEADETYVGGKPRRHPREKRGTMRQAVSLAKQSKTPVVGILERGGRVRAVPIKPITKRGVQRILRVNIDLRNSRLITDEHPVYHGISRYLPHDTVEHQQAYVMGEDIQTQGIENFWSLLKRGLIGTFHHVEAKYLEGYVDEFAFRFNARKMTDEERFASALGNAQGRLTWFFGQASQGESHSAS